MVKKQKVADSEVDGKLVDAQPSSTSAHLDNHQPRSLRPKRIGAGKGRAAQQLKNYGNAIVRAVPKCARLTVPSSEPINKMVPSLKKRRQRSKVQSAKGKGKGLPDPAETPTKYAQKPIFQTGDQSSRYEFKVTQQIQSNLRPKRSYRLSDEQLPNGYHELPVDETVEEWFANGARVNNIQEEDGPVQSNDRQGDASHSDDNDCPRDATSNSDDEDRSTEHGESTGHPGDDENCLRGNEGSTSDEEDSEDDEDHGDNDKSDHAEHTRNDGPAVSQDDSDSGSKVDESPSLRRSRRHHNEANRSRMSHERHARDNHTAQVRGMGGQWLNGTTTKTVIMRVVDMPTDGGRQMTRMTCSVTILIQNGRGLKASRDAPGARHGRLMARWDHCKDSHHEDRRHAYRWSERGEADDEYHVLDHHHQRNRLQRLGSRQLSRVYSRSDTKVQPSRCVKKAEKQGFWPEVWKAFIDEAKLEWRIYLAASDAFLDPTTLNNGTKFLCMPPDARAKERNFAHKVLFAISVAAYYRNSQKLLGATPEFQKYLPEAAVVLVAAGIKSVLQSLMQHGKVGDIQTESGHIDKRDYEKLYGLIGDVTIYQIAPITRTLHFH
ncbi:hypothetical protein EV363DRAFT_1295737 [Boletus edulis]|nr:hypothetical protein EV363DRAFT_1295737 [Boletus edulis]